MVLTTVEISIMESSTNSRNSSLTNRMRASDSLSARTTCARSRRQSSQVQTSPMLLAANSVSKWTGWLRASTATR